MKKIILSLLIYSLFTGSVWADSGFINADSVNLRQKPSTKAEIITQVSKGDKINVVKNQDKWVLVQSKKQKGWVLKDYIKLILVRNVKADVLNVRSKPDTKSDTIAQIKQGTKIVIVKKGKDWSLIKTQDNKTGWVANKFLKKPVQPKTKIALKPAKKEQPSKKIAKVKNVPKADQTKKIAKAKVMIKAPQIQIAMASSLPDQTKEIEKAKNEPTVGPSKSDNATIITKAEPDKKIVIKEKKPFFVCQKPASAEPIESKILAVAKKYLGYPYRYGGESPSTGFDCSGFVKFVYSHFKVNLPHRADLQFNYGVDVAKKDLQPGDIVFFKSLYESGIGHVGIYAGNNKFIHASQTGRPVIYSTLSTFGYVRRYAGAKRIFI